MAEPRDRRYTRTHEWVLVDGEHATVGITNFAQEQLGDVVFVELPQVGAPLGQGDSLGNIESVKAVSEVFAPVAGEVIEVNENLQDEPDLMNRDPYGDGFLVRMKVAAGAADDLLDVDAYEALVAEEGAH